MTPEARLDRLERILRLFVKAGLRYRRNLSSLDDKVNVVVSMQIGSEERFAHNELVLAKLSERTDQGFAQLAEAQAVTERKLSGLIDLVRNRGNE